MDDRLSIASGPLKTIAVNYQSFFILFDFLSTFPLDFQLSSDGTVEITRVQAATPPISGTFELGYMGRMLSHPLPADASATMVKSKY